MQDRPQSERSRTSSRLAGFIREHHGEILSEWERDARGLPGAENLDRPALIDHVPELLDRIADIAGELAAGGRPSLPNDIAALHAVERLEEGFELSQVVVEFALLRDAITRLWEHEQPPAGQLAELRLLNQALDRAIAESVELYTKARARAVQGLDRIASAARESAATRARQQEAVTNLGAFALETVNVQTIMQRAVELIADTLGVELTKILELAPDGASLVLRAGVGWDGGLVGRALVDAGPESHMGFTLKSAEPVIVDDLRSEVRFKGSPILHEHGVVSGMSAIIHAPGHAGRPYGVFGAHTRAQRTFTPNDVTFLQAVANVVASAIIRRKSEEDLDAAEQRLSLYPEQIRLLAVIADSVPILVSYIGPDLRYRFTNKAYEAWFGRSRDDIQGKHMRDVLGDVAYERLRPHAEAARAGRPVHYEQELPYSSGTRYVEATYLPDVAAGGAANGFVAIVADITEKKRVEAAEKKARAEAERALAVVDALLSSSLVGFGFLDAELRYVRVNEALAAMNGSSPAAHIGRSVRDMLGGHADSLEPTLQRVIETGEPAPDMEITAAPPSTPDQLRSFLANYFPVRTPPGEIIGVGAAVIEITERKRIEARMQKALSIQTVGVLFFDLRGRILDANPALERLSGYSHEQLRTMSWQVLTPPEFSDVTARAAQEIAAKGETAPYEKQWLRPDGSRWWGLFAPTRIGGGEGDSECVEFIIDITARKHVEEALRESELQFRTLADSISQFAWTADGTGSIFWYNQRWFEYTGTTLEEMQGWGGQKVQHPEHVERVTAKFRRHVEAGEVWEDTFPLRGKDGRYRWFLSRALPIHDERGNVVRWFGTNTDVTETRLLSEVTTVLSASLDYRETLHKMAQLAVPALADWCVVDLVERDGEVKRIAVVHSDPSKQTLAADLEHNYPPDWDAPSGSANVIRTGVPELVEEVSDELLVQRARGSEHLQLLRALGLQSYMVVPLVARGRTLGAMGIASTQSGIRYGKKDLEFLEEMARRAAIAVDNARLYEEAQRAIRMREEVLAVVSHDLKNPLGAIQMAGAMLLRRPQSDLRSRKHVETINRSVSRMDHLIGDLLDMASIQAGRLAIERKLDEPEGIVLEAVEMHEPAAREKGIQLNHACELRGLRLLVDRDRFLQVLGNLLGNAIKFCRSGDDITVRGERSETEALFAVSDTGPGIPESDLPHIFEPYWSAKKHAKKGTGLGLYISKGIVEAHGGKLSVESTQGEGTTFRFTLPL